MAQILEWLRGKKTYIIVIVGAVLNVLVQLEIVPADGAVVTLVNTILLALFGATLRAGVTKSSPK